MNSQSAAISKQLLQGLLRQADPSAARQGQSYFKQPVELIGVSAAKMRDLAREAHLNAKATLTAADAIAICERLLPDKRLEVKGTALLFLARFRKQLDSSIFRLAKRWIETDWCSSWSVIDELCIDILGPMLQASPEWFRLPRAWHRSNNMWLRRAAMVVLVKPARRGLLLDEVFETTDRLLCDSEDLVQKAAGWLLREAGKTDMSRLQTFLEKNGGRCARTTLRYAIERFPAPKRLKLLRIPQR